MWGLSLVLTLLFLKGPQGQDSAKRVVGLSGTCLRLWPPTTLAKNIESVQWKRPGPSPSEFSVILTWKCGSNYCSDKNWTLNHLNKRFGFITQNLSLTIQAAQQQDSGFYIFEATDEHGKVKNYTFQVSVFDHVGEPHVLQDLKVLEGGRCQVTLSCSVPSGDNVSYDWYRGSVLIETARNHSTLEDQIDANSSHIYTCNVSNSVSWTNRTFILHCPGDSQQDKSLHLLVIIVVLLITLFLGALTGFCVWRRKMKQSRKWRVPRTCCCPTCHPPTHLPGSTAPASLLERWDVCACTCMCVCVWGAFLPAHAFWGSSRCIQPNVQIYLPVAGLLGCCPGPDGVGVSGGCWSRAGLLGRAPVCLLSRTFLEVLATWAGGGTVQRRSLDRTPSGGLCISVSAAFLSQRTAQRSF
ncbi:natural killer cell receptor 2B4 isoform X1 [Acinonyx jubatus]|uniref:Natural killer cell receptor 2B4 isoform X1 n=1 Tax=Acinonyx jubatus TaxID=32536 RepID=A0ABM3P084_ACIJB|nr:natural killer cell receptor 2B4 isoform X1 [Acinonyx jubatus]